MNNLTNQKLLINNKKNMINKQINEISDEQQDINQKSKNLDSQYNINSGKVSENIRNKSFLSNINRSKYNIDVLNNNSKLPIREKNNVPILSESLSPSNNASITTEEDIDMKVPYLII